MQVAPLLHQHLSVVAPMQVVPHCTRAFDRQTPCLGGIEEGTDVSHLRELQACEQPPPRRGVYRPNHHASAVAPHLRVGVFCWCGCNI